MLADSGARVGIFDIDAAKLERLMAGRMPFMERGADALLEQVLGSGRLEVSAEPAMVARATVVIVVIGTPVDEFLGPSMTVFERSADESTPTMLASRSSQAASGPRPTPCSARDSVGRASSTPTA